MANEMIGAGHTDCQVINGRRVVYVAAEAEAVRVTVRRDGQTRSAKVEILAPDITDGWVPTVLEAVRVDGSAESGRVGAVLTFPGGEWVTIGAPAEALRASARCVDPPTSDGAREEPAPQAARWWQTVGAWGTREGRDTAGVVLVAPEGAWMRYPNGAQQWMTAATLDGMTPIPAPPPPPPQPPPVEPIKYVLKVDGSPTSEAISAAFERAVGVRLPAVAAPEPSDAPSAEEVSGLKARAVSALRAALGAMEAERDSLRDALASLESTFRGRAESEQARTDSCGGVFLLSAWTMAAEDVARARKAAL